MRFGVDAVWVAASLRLVAWVELPDGFSVRDPTSAATQAARAQPAASVSGALSAFCDGADALVAYNGTGLDFDALDDACERAVVRPVDGPARVDALYLAYTWWPTQPTHRLRPLASAIGVDGPCDIPVAFGALAAIRPS